MIKASKLKNNTNDFTISSMYAASWTGFHVNQLLLDSFEVGVEMGRLPSAMMSHNFGICYQKRRKSQVRNSIHFYRIDFRDGAGLFLALCIFKEDE